jgi:hypothetical protein
MSAETYTCPHCGAQSYAYWHAVTPGIVNALIKMKRAVIAKGTNSVHNRKDMDGRPFELTKSEAANWTMLRYHGLVAKDKDAGRGYWLLTHRGAEFLKGNLAVPARVKTLNNHVIDHDDEYVSIQDVLGTLPYFETLETLEREAVGVNPQLSLLEAV